MSAFNKACLGCGGLLLGFFRFMGNLSSEKSISNFLIYVLTREEFLELLASRTRIRVVDVLSREHYEKEHIEGAISLPVNEIEDRVFNVLDKDETIVVYCANVACQASTRAAEKLLELGFKHVFKYTGGIKDYKEATLPLEGSLHGTTAQASGA